MVIFVGKVNIVFFKELIHFVEELLPSDPLLAIFLQAPCNESPHSQRNSD